VGSRWDCEVWVCEVEQRWYRGGTEVVSGWDRGGIGKADESRNKND